MIKIILKSKKESGSCPKATQDLKLNTKNRNSSIKAEHIQYGPLNLSDEDYWVRAAKHWNTTPEVAKKSKCGNCTAFDVSPRMLDCLPGPVSEPTEDEEGKLGYCWMHHFKCHSARTCYTWAAGGPISKDDVSHQWQEKSEQSVSESRAEKKSRGLTMKKENLSRCDMKKIIREELEIAFVNEKDDRCTRIAKSKYDAWPSAYASGAVVRCRAGKIWKDLKETDDNLDENTENEQLEALEEDEGLKKWFDRQGAPGKKGGWVDCNTCRTDKKTGKKKCKACGREKGEKRSKYPRCRPTPSQCKGYKRKGSNLQKEDKIEEIEYNYIPAREATYDDGNPIDFILEFWDDVVVEAEYQGRKVTLNKPMQGDVKKFKVYVKDPKTKNVKKVNFGDPNMRIKKSNPKRRKSFRARHNCDNPGPKTKARYWSCRKW